MCTPSPPKTPDIKGAAEAQGQANLEAAIATGQLNNPQVNSPYGTQTVTYDGTIPTVTQTFSPEQQELYERQVQMKQGLADIGITGTGVLGDVIGQNIDFSTLPAGPGDSQATRDKVVGSMMSRVDTDIAQQRDNANSQLVAAGIRPGTEAYDREMTRFDRIRTDALQQAQLAGGQEASRDFQLDAERRRTGLAEMLTGRQTPLNEITALMSGSQVNNPFAGNLGFQAGAQAAPAPLFKGSQAQWQADMDRYNAQAAGAGGMMSGLFDLGSAYLGRG
jgi:hypothetical protein